jgi:UDP-glucuronate 4-epimerase
VQVLVTGVAGFIGFHTAQTLLARGLQVIGIDNLNDYYNVSLKRDRLLLLEEYPSFLFKKIDIADRENVLALVEEFPALEFVVHLAGQAGVRHSLVEPYTYITSNVMGHVVMLELARKLRSLKNYIYASSSSVYGGNTKMPFSVGDRVDTPQSLYAATKLSDELISCTYAHLYKIPQVGLRFFTVYGPWGRPDMSFMLFAKSILAGEPIRVFNHGEMWRDFTFVDDIVQGILAAMNRPPSGSIPHVIYNLANHKSEKLTDMIALLEGALGRNAVIQYEPLQPGDVEKTYADIRSAQEDLGFNPTTPISTGIPKFVSWYRSYFGV